MKISWVILTMNRYDTVLKSVAHNLENAGRPIDETIWVDNGSSTEELSKLYQLFESRADVKILNKENLGVSKGYNRGMAMATGDLIVITGCDRLMPKNWLSTMELYFEHVQNTGIISVYSQPLNTCPERFLGGNPMIEVYGELDLIPAMPIGAKLFRRSILKDIGYLREDFGLYGWEDVEWGYRAIRYCEKKGLLSYILPEFLSEHMGSEGIKEFNGRDEQEYHAFKQREAADPKKSAVMDWCKENGFPYYNPYA